MDSDSPIARLFNNNSFFNNNPTTQLRDGHPPYPTGSAQSNDGSNNNNNDPTAPEQPNDDNDRRFVDEQSTMFSDYVRLTQSDRAEQSRRRLVCQCVICYNINDISKTEVGEPFSTLPQGDPEYGSVLCETALLPCGHLVGWNCLRQTTINDDLCPICRQQIDCAKCRRPLAVPCVRRLPGGQFKRIAGDAPMPAGNGPDGRPKNIYCSDCVKNQAVLLLNTLFAGTEACPLCVPGNRYYQPKETVEEHRDRRAGFALRYFEEMISRVGELAYPSALGTMWDQERAARLREVFARDRLKLVDALKRSPYTGALYRRIFANCLKTKERAGPVTQRDVVAMTLLATELAPTCKLIMDGTLAWFTDLDEWMATDITVPARW
ncbi:hypothetical protein PGQ11_009641 [Apiospora arundinis]|uniref:RING-type domain-containing protein n=1 Tax=Apiospora arundinis TaxID=335852 RepID=A0ABR2IJI6_9PEZI